METRLAPRKIVRDPEIHSGRWRLEGTDVPIAEIIRSGHLERGALKEQFLAIKPTDDEIDAIFAFEFPAIRKASVRVDGSSVVMSCECGESTEKDNTVGGTTDITCPCGRTWRVAASIERVLDGSEIGRVPGPPPERDHSPDPTSATPTTAPPDK